MIKEIRSQAEDIQEFLVDFRRDLHKYPEQGWLEIRTSYKIMKELEKLSCKILIGDDLHLESSKMGVPDKKVMDEAYKFAVENGTPIEYAEKFKNSNTGLMAIFELGDGPVTAMRFDIDALPLVEDDRQEHFPVKAKFSSINKSSMHACGHDAHASIGVGTAILIESLKENLRGTIKLIFQPAEEGVRGAKSIVDKGHLDNVSSFFSSHITTNENNEDFDFFPGSGRALATTKLDVEFFGKSSHAGGSPNEGKNVMLASANSILNIYAIPRHKEGVSRVNIGQINAGTGRNIIADYAKLLIEVRGETNNINDYIRDYTYKIIENSAKMHDVDFKIKKVGEAVSFCSSKDLMSDIRKLINELGYKATKKDMMTLAGSEDVSFMINKVQDNGGEASFIRLLTRTSAGAHNISYDLDEQILSKAVALFTASVYRKNSL